MYKIQEFQSKDWPGKLKEIPDPPKKLYYAGPVPDQDRKLLCVVGSRKYTNYGKEACEYLIQGLRGYPVTIVSGLALGIDSIAHRAALNNGLPTIGMPGSGLSPKALHPQSHVQLAEEIVEAKGTLISEMEPGDKASILMHDVEHKRVFWSFPRRNRLMVAISDAVLVVEAGLKSGTLITAKLATEYNRDLLVIPGSIFSSASEGANMFLRLGATAVTKPEDIIEVLNLDNSKLELKDGKKKISKDYKDCSESEKKIILILGEQPLAKDDLIRAVGMQASEVQTTLTLLELKGYIIEKLGEFYLT